MNYNRLLKTQVKELPQPLRFIMAFGLWPFYLFGYELRKIEKK